MKIITDAEFEQQCRESLEYEQIDFNIRGFDEVGASKTQWGEMQYCSASFSSGIELDMFDEQIYLDSNCLVEMVTLRKNL